MALLITSLFIVIWGTYINAEISLLQVLINITMLQQFLGVQHVDGVYWSLTYELVFYFWVALLLAFNKRHWLIPLMTLFSFFSILSLFVLLPKILVNIFMLEWVYYFSGGILFYNIYSNNNKKVSTFLVLTSALIAIVFSYKQAIGLSTYHTSDINPIVSCSIVFTFYLLFYFLSTTKLKLSNKIGNIAENLGRLTYPLYLIHGTIGIIIFNVIGPYLPKEILLPLVIGLVTLFAWLINKHIEKRYYIATRNLVNSILSKITTRLHKG